VPNLPVEEPQQIEKFTVQGGKKGQTVAKGNYSSIANCQKKIPAILGGILVIYFCT